MVIDRKGLPLIALRATRTTLSGIYEEELDFESADCSGAPWIQILDSEIPSIFHVSGQRLFVADTSTETSRVEIRSSRLRVTGACFTIPAPAQVDELPALATPVILEDFTPPFRVTTPDRLRDRR